MSLKVSTAAGTVQAVPRFS